MRISDWSSDVCSSDLRIILVADGLRAGGTHYAAIAKPGSPAILVTGDTVLTQGFERIDATRRWGGLASISQPMVAELAAMPGEWDMMLTLLRLAVQAGARRQIGRAHGRNPVNNDHIVFRLLLEQKKSN